MHVAILSCLSFVGRLSSGIGSDYVVQRYHSSRFWMLVISALIFTAAQVSAMIIENPNVLFLLSSLTGLGYGALFGVYPALVADAFGPSGMGINWYVIIQFRMLCDVADRNGYRGAMTMAPVVSGNLFNLIYGSILDAHSTFEPGEGRTCLDGKECYSKAYIVTLVASVLAVIWSFWCIRQETQQKRAQKQNLDDHEG